MEDQPVAAHGWLFAIKKDRYGGPYSDPTYCVLQGPTLSQYDVKPTGNEAASHVSVLGSGTRVEEHGRARVNNNAFYTFSVHSTGASDNQLLQLASSSSEDAGTWILALKTAHAELEYCGVGPPRIEADTQPNHTDISFQLPEDKAIGSETPDYYEDWTDPYTARLGHVAEAPGTSSSSQWRLIKLKNGLRFFEESSDINTRGCMPVVKAVGVVEAAADAVFNIVMGLGPERAEWDPAFEQGGIVEQLDGHNDIVHICLRRSGWWQRPRDLCVMRCWKREEDGSYVLLYRSTSHPRCPVTWSHARATIRSGGFVISPLQGNLSQVEHMLEFDASGWSAWLGPALSAYPKQLLRTLLNRVAGLREYFKIHRVGPPSSIAQRRGWDWEHPSSSGGACRGVNGAHPIAILRRAGSADSIDFYDAREDRLSESGESLLSNSDIEAPHGTSRWGSDLQEPLLSHSVANPPWLAQFRGTVRKGRDGEPGRDCWSRPDPRGFQIRPKDFLRTKQKVPAGEPFLELVAVDWLKSSQRLDHVGSRQQRTLQKGLRQDGPFVLALNLQVPAGKVHYSLVFYFATDKPITPNTLFYRFLNSDDNFRNDRLTLLPCVPAGSWIVKQSVGQRPVPLGQVLDCRYFRGEHYLEIDVDMGVSAVVRGVMSLVLPIMTMLVVDMAIVVRGDTEDELPEVLLGAVRCHHLEIGSAVHVTS